MPIDFAGALLGLEQSQLLAGHWWRVEFASLQHQVPPVHAEPLATSRESLLQELSNRTATAHSLAEGGLVQCPASGLTHQAKDPARLVRYMCFQPLDEELFDLARQAKQNVAGAVCTSRCRSL